LPSLIWHNTGQALHSILLDAMRSLRGRERHGSAPGALSAASPRPSVLVCSWSLMPRVAKDIALAHVAATEFSCSRCYTGAESSACARRLQRALTPGLPERPASAHPM